MDTPRLLPMEISEARTGAAIYERLYGALQGAAMAEQELRNPDREKGYVHPDIAANKRLDNITGTVLPEQMGKVIGLLDLHTPFQSLGRYVRSFEDAAFVVRSLRQQMLAELNKGECKALDAIEKLIACSTGIA